MGTAATEVRRNTSSVEAFPWTSSDQIRTDLAPAVREAVAAEARAFFDKEAAEGRLNAWSFEVFLHGVKAAALASATEVWNARPEVVPASAPRSR